MGQTSRIGNLKALIVGIIGLDLEKKKQNQRNITHSKWCKYKYLFGVLLQSVKMWPADEDQSDKTTVSLALFCLSVKAEGK